MPDQNAATPNPQEPSRDPLDTPTDRPVAEETVIASGPVHFFFNRFLFGFCAHWPLPVILFLIFCLTLGLGEGFGVTDLVYHADRGQQFLVGAMLAIVSVTCVFAGFVLDTRWFPLVRARGSWYDVLHWGSGRTSFGSHCRSCFALSSGCCCMQSFI